MVLAIFVLTYLGIAAGRVPGLKLNRVGIALLGAIATMVFGRIGTAQAISFVNWPTILLLFGFLVISAQLRLSGFYDRVARAVADRLGHPARFLLVLMAVTAGLSAFLNHDIVCVVFAPIVCAALLRQGLNPVPFLVALAVSSNIGSAATLIGNAQDMMIGAVAGLAFGRYLAWSILPVSFALAAAYGIIWLLARRDLRRPVPTAEPPSRAGRPFDRRHTAKGLSILVVVVGLLFSPLPKEVVALAAAAIHLASPKFRTEDLLGLVDWPLLVLFISLFVLTGAFQSAGYGSSAVHWLGRSGLSLEQPAPLVLTAAGLSNLISNAAAVMLLTKVVSLSRITAYLLCLANSFGGSLIVIGSISNLIVVQQARAFGIDISFRQFARFGLPVTAAALGGLLAWTALAGNALW